MSIYDRLMEPLETRVLAGMRRELISYAYGDVLELGAKTGANFQYYNPARVNRLIASDLRLDPAIYVHAPAFVSFQECSAERLPFPDATFDTVVETLVFCTVGDVTAAIKEIRRVLKSGGLFLHLDHGLPASPTLAAVFRGINLFWPHFTGGCNLTRQPHSLIAASGFKYERQENDSAEIFRWGVARKID